MVVIIIATQVCSFSVLIGMVCVCVYVEGGDLRWDLQWDPVVYYVNHIKLLIVLSDTCVTFFLTNNVIFNKNILKYYEINN